MKGHLDVKDLEKYKKADLQALARDLGVSDEGTVKEIAARCAAVEVEIPDEPDGAQPPAQNPEGQQPDGTQPPAQNPEGQQPDGTQPPAQNPEGQQQGSTQKNKDEVEVEAVQTYKDLELKRIVEKGERITVKKARAEVLTEHKVARAVEN